MNVRYIPANICHQTAIQKAMPFSAEDIEFAPSKKWSHQVQMFWIRIDSICCCCWICTALCIFCFSQIFARFKWHISRLIKMLGYSTYLNSFHIRKSVIIKSHFDALRCNLFTSFCVMCVYAGLQSRCKFLCSICIQKISEFVS